MLFRSASTETSSFESSFELSIEFADAFVTTVVAIPEFGEACATAKLLTKRAAVVMATTETLNFDDIFMSRFHSLITGAENICFRLPVLNSMNLKDMSVEAVRLLWVFLLVSCSTTVLTPMGTSNRQVGAHQWGLVSGQILLVGC